MKITIRPEEIVKRCLWDTYVYYVLQCTEKEAERILKEKKPIEVLNRAKKLQARTYTLIGIIHSKQGNN